VSVSEPIYKEETAAFLLGHSRKLPLLRRRSAKPPSPRPTVAEER
jgi:hypothetical protein